MLVIEKLSSSSGCK